MTDPGSPLFDFVKTMAVLGGILALAWAALKLWLPKLAVRGAQAEIIEIVARRPLEAKKTLYVIRVGKSNSLIAVAGDNVTFLQTVELEALPEQVAEPESSFAQRLRALRGAGDRV